MRALQARRPNVAVLVDAIDQEYQQRVIRGIHDEAENFSVDVTCFVGGSLHAPGAYESALNSAYELCSAEHIDALIVLSGTLANECGMDALSAYCRRFAGVPVCSLGGALKGAVEVTVDIKAAVRQALVHLAQSCGRRRVAFIRGPSSNDEAERRYAAYLEAAAELRLAPEPELVVDGDFLEPSGVRAVEILLDERRQGFDALMAASDLMAIGAMKELTARQVRVPEKVAVVGFDDIEAARIATPALGTIRQPLYEQGRRALREVIARLSEPSLPERVYLDARFISRASCGTRSVASMASWLSEVRREADPPESQRFEQAYQQIQPRLLGDLKRTISEIGLESTAQVAETLLVQACTDIQGRRRGLLQGQSFVSFLETTLQASSEIHTEDLSAWQEVINTLRRHFDACLRLDPKWRRNAEELWHQSRAAICHTAERHQARRWLREVHLFDDIRHASVQLNNSCSWTELHRLFASASKAVGAEPSFAVVRRGDELHSLSSLSRSEAARADSERSYGADRLAPPSFRELHRTTRILLPLVGRQGCYGYVTFDGGALDGRLYCALRDALATSVEGLTHLDPEPPTEATPDPPGAPQGC